MEEVHRAETEIVNVRWSGVARNVVPCSLVERCEQRSASGVGGGVHGDTEDRKERGRAIFISHKRIAYRHDTIISISCRRAR